MIRTATVASKLSNRACDAGISSASVGPPTIARWANTLPLGVRMRDHDGSARQLSQVQSLHSGKLENLKREMTMLTVLLVIGCNTPDNQSAN